MHGTSHLIPSILGDYSGSCEVFWTVSSTQNGFLLK